MGEIVEPGSHADEFLSLICLRYNGEDQSASWFRAAGMITPDLARENIFTAAALADPAAIAEHLRADPQAAKQTGGPHGWEPLLYLAYSRYRSMDESSTIESAQLLIDAGADPNAAWFHPGEPSRFTVITGALGSGEQSTEQQPAHEHGLALARVLLQAGASASDEQALYNRMFESDDAHLRLLCEFGLGSTPESAELLRQQLVWACAHGFVDRVRLVADQGIDLSEPLRIGLTPLEISILTGQTKVTALLLDRGVPQTQDPALQFVAAVFAGDADTLATLPADAAAAARIRYPALILRAAVANRRDAIGRLVDEGFDINAMGRADLPLDEPWETALHAAAADDNHLIASRLLELGADPTITDRRFGATAGQWAAHLEFADLQIMIEEGFEPELDEDFLDRLGIDWGDGAGDRETGH